MTRDKFTNFMHRKGRRKKKKKQEKMEDVIYSEKARIRCGRGVSEEFVPFLYENKYLLWLEND